LSSGNLLLAKTFRMVNCCRFSGPLFAACLNVSNDSSSENTHTHRQRSEPPFASQDRPKWSGLLHSHGGVCPDTCVCIPGRPLTGPVALPIPPLRPSSAAATDALCRAREPAPGVMAAPIPGSSSKSRASGGTPPTEIRFSSFVLAPVASLF
jgi:hypothetical protein